MREWPVTVIPNPIDVEIWKPIEKDVARMILGIPCDALVVAFGAVGGTRDPNKGFDSLKTALELLRGTLNGLQLIVFGQIPPKEHMTFGIPVRFAGALHDDLSLRVLYSAADVVVVPSRRESLSYCAIEAHACGTPVVAFDTSGIPDVVEHRMTGYLAAPFDPYDLTAGIRWVLDDSCRCKALGRRAREVAVARYSVPVIAEQYVRVYESVLSR